ncbi:MAG: Ppx/GppA phosphatase family protein [Planctomycetota bacterium]
MDLGSNSFHAVVAMESESELVVLDRVRERVGLAEGLTDDGQLNEEVAARALACLQRIGERLKGIPKHRVRAVGTATFRDVRDGRKFLRRAQSNLGHEIETLPGKEEARLIYLGVAHSLGDDDDGRLVFDIGGGSTEIIVGRKFESQKEASVSLGCIHHSKRFFGDGTFTPKAFKRAIAAARLEIEPITEEIGIDSWKQCVGASGTILAVASIMDALRGTPGPLTPADLDELIDRMCKAGSVQKLDLPGLAEDRRTVLAGGLSILRALSQEFQVKTVGTAPGALREGLLYDLLGRLHHEDVRHRSVTALAQRFGTQNPHAEAVARTAAHMFEQVREPWDLKRRHERLLQWAAHLAEIGMSVSYSGYQRHSGYLIENSDMPGFSDERRGVLAEIVRYHRRRTRQDAFGNIEDPERRRLLRITALLRIAHRLHRTRASLEVVPVTAKAKGKKLELTFPTDWFEKHSLQQEDLEQEATWLGLWNVQLSVL